MPSFCSFLSGKFLTVIFSIILSGVYVHSRTEVPPHHFNTEALSYSINYKWGLINKKAGSATITIAPAGDRYYTKLTGRTEPWADKFYKVRDTLNGVMSAETLKPFFYEKIAREDDTYKHDVVKFSYDDNGTVTGDCLRKVYKKGKLKKDEKRRLISTGLTVDMLASFFLMRTFPYQSWQKGHKEIMTIFSGKRKETLTIKYHGIEDVKIGSRTFHCYHITFIFTSDGGKKTSDDMDAWITDDSRRIPVKLQGNLAIGKVQCLYTGQ